MRILEIETFGRGGLTHYAHNLSWALAERGHEVTLVTAADYELDGESPLPASLSLVKLIAHGASQIRLPRFAASLARKVEAVHDAFAVAALAQRRRPDVIHLHCTNPVALVYLALLRRAGCPVVYTAHVVTPHEPMRLEQPVYRSIHRLSDLIVAHSEVDRRRLIDEFRVEPRRVVVIPHGEYGFFERGQQVPDRDSARAQLGIDRDAAVALFFGYIREYKGLDVLLEAWPAVAAALPQARLLVAGDPIRLGAARRRELQDWAARVGAVHRFAYIPFAEVPLYFAAADALVMPYRRISQSGVLFLALALGVPVVASRVGALSEMLEHRTSAVLVPPEARDELASALIEVLGDADLRSRLAAGALRVAEQHSWPMIAERTERSLLELVAAQPERS
jgi:glycosyltransferase involved in cell wall biosynthesis